MERYIDADKLIEELKELQKLHSPSLTKTTNEAIDLGLSLAIRRVRNTPAADVVEVVRCKECEYWSTEYRFCKRFGVDCYGNSSFYEDSYCSLGKRKGSE